MNKIFKEKKILKSNLQFKYESIYSRIYHIKFFLRIESKLQLEGFFNFRSLKIKTCSRLILNSPSLRSSKFLSQKLAQSSKRLLSIDFTNDESHLKALKLYKKLSGPHTKLLKAKIEKIPYVLIKYIARDIQTLSLHAQFDEQSQAQQKLKKILDLLVRGPNRTKSPILIITLGLKYDSAFLKNLYLRTIKNKLRPLNFLADLTDFDMISDEISLLGKNLRTKISTDNLELPYLYSSSNSQILTLFQSGLNENRNFFANIFNLVSLRELYLKISTASSKEVFESLKFPASIYRLSIEFRDVATTTVPFNYTAGELHGHAERKRRACNLIDRVKYMDSFLGQLKDLVKLKRIRFTISCFHQSHHVYAMFLYALCKRFNQNLEALWIGLAVFAENMKEKETCDLNFPTLLEFLGNKHQLKTLKVNTHILSFDGYDALKHKLPTRELSFSRMGYQDIKSIEGSMALLKNIQESNIEFFESFAINVAGVVRNLVEKNTLRNIKYLVLFIELYEQLNLKEIEALFASLVYKNKLQMLVVEFSRQDINLSDFKSISKLLNNSGIDNIRVEIGGILYSNT